MLKLFHYGFDNDSIDFLKDYFTDRTQKTKIMNTVSDFNEIKLGVPQGSVLGPLFFLIFINDLPFFIDMVKSKLFADDTTLYEASNEINSLISKFGKTFDNLQTWCNYNQIDINFSKTFIMIITKKRIKRPSHLTFGNISIKVVNQFKLLGVILDEDLTLAKHIASTRLKINFKLYSLKKPFHLSTAVKVQFFKTFILPFFDYCISLLIYCQKSLIQKLCNSYCICIFKLFGSVKTSTNINSDTFTDVQSLNKFLKNLTFYHLLIDYF